MKEDADAAADQFMALWSKITKDQPSLVRDFIWANYDAIYADQTEISRITAWLEWWNVWPVSWEDICDLSSGVLTDEQRQLRNYRSTLEFFGAAIHRVGAESLPATDLRRNLP